MPKKFKCPLCGTEYATEKEVIVCVNKCGREKFSNGAFIKKEAPHSPDRISFDTNESPLSNHQLILKTGQKVKDLYDFFEHERNFMARKQVLEFSDNYKSNLDKANRPYLISKYNEISLMKQIYMKED